MPPLSETFAATLTRFTDAELVEAERMGRVIFAETILAVENQSGVPFERWLFDTVSEECPKELEATVRWLATLCAWLTSPLGSAPRADQIAGLAGLLAWITET